MLYPSILTDSLAEAQQQLNAVKDVEGIEVFQVDIIDGQFADNLTITPCDLENFDFGSAQIDLHLMTEEPMDYLYECIGVEDALPIRGMIAQVERMSYQQSFLEEVAKHDWQPGLSLDLFTPVEAIEETSWPHLKVVQLMAIEAGFQGQKLQDQVYDKIAELTAELERRELEQVEIVIDGGVSLQNLPKLLEAGASSVAVGSDIWQADNPAQAAAEFVSSLESA